MHFTSDITFEKDSPIFTTGKHQLVYVCGGEVDDRETEMIAVRWEVLRFFFQIHLMSKERFVRVLLILLISFWKIRLYTETFLYSAYYMVP